MSQVSVDVLITFYNQEKYVDQAILSVLNQKGDFSLRILIGDDGSTDHTVDLVEKYIKQYPNMIFLFHMGRDVNERTLGGFRASRNRINLLKQVRADYFIFLDGDDYFDSDWKLQKQIGVLEAEENQDCTACGHAIDALHADGSRSSYARIQNHKDKYTLKEYWTDIYIHTDTILSRSSVIESMPLDLVENNFNDTMISFLILTQGNLFYLPEAMAVYRQTGDGIWTSGNTVLNLLRNMMIYDLSIKIRPGLRRAAQKRFAYTWKMLYNIRADIVKESCEVLYEEAVSKKLPFTKMWIEYQGLTYLGKCRLMFEYGEIRFIQRFEGNIHHIKRIIVARK